MIAQFGPYNWVEFEWRPLSSLGRWCATLGIVFLVSDRFLNVSEAPATAVTDYYPPNVCSAQFTLTELNTFYLKFVLWVPPDHWLNLIRLFLVLSWGAVGLRETFQYLDDP